MSEPINVKGPEEFKAKILDSKVPVLVDFWASWCMPCRLMAPVLEDLAKTKDAKLVVAKVNTEESENRELSYLYQIQSIPNMKLFENGKVVREFIGFRPKEILNKEINEFLDK